VFENNESDTEYITCPFCGQEDFDLPGLKYHFIQGHCEIYNETENWIRRFF